MLTILVWLSLNLNYSNANDLQNFKSAHFQIISRISFGSFENKVNTLQRDPWYGSTVLWPATWIWSWVRICSSLACKFASSCRSNVKEVMQSVSKVGDWRNQRVQEIGRYLNDGLTWGELIHCDGLLMVKGQDIILFAVVGGGRSGCEQDPAPELGFWWCLRDNSRKLFSVEDFVTHSPWTFSNI